MKAVRTLFLLVVCSCFFSCSDNNTFYYDVPSLLNMTKPEIDYRLGKPDHTRKMKEFGANMPSGFITIPAETIMDTYISHGYALRIYYVLDKCEKPIEFFLYKEEDDTVLDSTAIVKLKRVYNLKDTTQLPKAVFQRASKQGYTITNIECR